MQIKICGVKTIDIANAAIAAGATHIGLNFFERSPRYITPAKAAEISHHIKNKIKIAAVTVDPTDELLKEITSITHLDYIQLHGHETPARAQEIKNKFGLKIIKAIPIKEKADLLLAEKFKTIADYILFDAKPNADAKLPGGNALSFDWNILKGFSPDYKYILSGGLTPSNVKQAIKTTNALFLDVSSGVESSSGVKDANLINSFINSANS